MPDYLGDFAVTQTVSCRFTTEDATGAPITLAGTPSARVRKGSGSGSTITAGVSLTVDVVTGQHVVDVDLTGSGSFTAGAEYAIELSAGTVSGVSVVGKVVGLFSIANRVAGASLSAAGVRTAVGLASANLDTQIAALPTAAQNADKLIRRNIAGGSDTGRLVKDALRFNRNKVTIVPINATSGTLTVYEEDDTTVAWTGTVTRASADALSAVDPS